MSLTATSSPDLADQVTAWLGTQQAAMEALLQEIVNIDSGSRQAAGVDQVAAVLGAHLERAGLTVQTQVFEGYGRCLQARLPATPGGQTDAGHVLLLGHMDTVFPAGTAQARPYRVEDRKAFGPGVADMKSGLVLNTFVLAALARFGGASRPVHLFFSCDEEIGSPVTRDAIRAAAQGAQVVLNAEPGRITGNVVTARKGSCLTMFEVQGVAAHAGINPAQGASAIEALAHKILALHALNGCEEGVTLNVGHIEGGMAANVVAPLAKAQLDLRFTAATDLEALLARVRQIIEAESLPRTHGRILSQHSTFPMAPTPASLLACYQRHAAGLGFQVEGEFTGGAADSGITSSMGIPTLCALGPVGGYAHSEREFCQLDTMVPRAQALALTILDPA
ncbi:M20 family metallopeptidase [Curvibacter sp. HBC28]|uniref:M20 family metallopeptidase n=1 Tax=Curvibacter microcysteis TaxID=3026419 RepID=A0ABT5MID3_9BURK|nr:M20 family metallopeptidase [Curvibacter sp. HBC28]MDD0815639.1 M20 family metallopeptidase [Curvibacter sp. HBC28]